MEKSVFRAGKYVSVEGVREIMGALRKVSDDEFKDMQVLFNWKLVKDANMLPSDLVKKCGNYSSGRCLEGINGGIKSYLVRIKEWEDSEVYCGFSQKVDGSFQFRMVLVCVGGKIYYSRCVDIDYNKVVTTINNSSYVSSIIEGYAMLELDLNIDIYFNGKSEVNSEVRDLSNIFSMAKVDKDENGNYILPEDLIKYADALRDCERWVSDLSGIDGNQYVCCGITGNCEFYFCFGKVNSAELLKGEGSHLTPKGFAVRAGGAYWGVSFKNGEYVEVEKFKMLVKDVWDNLNDNTVDDFISRYGMSKISNFFVLCRNQLNSDSGWRVDDSRLTKKSFKGIELREWEKFKKKIEHWISVDDFDTTKGAFNYHPMKDEYRGYIRFDDNPWRAYGPVDRDKKIIYIEVVGHKNKVVNAWVLDLLGKRKAIYNRLLGKEGNELQNELGCWQEDLDSTKQVIDALKGKNFLETVNYDYLWQYDDEIRLEGDELICGGIRGEVKEGVNLIHEIIGSLRLAKIAMRVETGKEWRNSSRDLAVSETEVGLYFLSKDLKKVIARQKWGIAADNTSKYGYHNDLFREKCMDLYVDKDTYLEYPRGFTSYDKDTDTYYVVGGDWLDSEVAQVVLAEFKYDPSMVLETRQMLIYNVKEVGIKNEERGEFVKNTLMVSKLVSVVSGTASTGMFWVIRNGSGKPSIEVEDEKPFSTDNLGNEWFSQQSSDSHHVMYRSGSANMERGRVAVYGGKVYISVGFMCDDSILAMVKDEFGLGKVNDKFIEVERTVEYDRVYPVEEFPEEEYEPFEEKEYVED